MTYSFRNKSAHKILNTFEAILGHEKEAREDIVDAFMALEQAAPHIRNEVLDDLENRIIRQAISDAVVWEEQRLQDAVADGYDDLPEPLAWASQYEMERLALLDELERLKPLAQTFMEISFLDDRTPQPWTQIFVKEYDRLTLRDRNNVEKVAECFAIARFKAAGLPPPVVPEPAAAFNAAAHDAALDQQEKLNKLAVGFRPRMI